MLFATRSRGFVLAIVLAASCADDDDGSGSARVCDKAREVAEACGGDQGQSMDGGSCEIPPECDGDADALIDMYECFETMGRCHDGMIEEPLAALVCFLAVDSQLSEACGNELMTNCRSSHSCAGDECTCQTEGAEGTSCCSEEQCPEDDPNSCSTVCRVCG